MKIKRFIGGSLMSNGYVVYEAGEAIVVDPGYRPEVFIKFLEKENLDLKAVFLTHFHYDHVGGAEKIGSLGVPIYIHRADLEGLKASLQKITTPVDEGFEIKLAGRTLKTMNLPGHTWGCTALIDEESKKVFTGDVIFDDDIGRTDLKEGSPNDMARSCKSFDETFDNSWTIYPGHGESATMKAVRKNNIEFHEALEYYKKL